MKLLRNFTSVSLSPRKRPPTCLVIHATVGGLTSSLSWLTNPASQVSCDFLISKAGVVYQLNPNLDQFYTWHAGECRLSGQPFNANAESIGIELENANTGKDPYPDLQIESLNALVADKAHKYAISVDRFYRHLDLAFPKGRKKDPAGFPWKQWIDGFGSQFPRLPRVIVHTLHIRSGPATIYPIVGRKLYGDRIVVLEKTLGEDISGNNEWGRIGPDEWVSLRWVEF